MTTKTYRALCNSVGAYEITYTYDIEGINWFGGIFTQTFTRNEFKEDAWRWKTKEYRVIKVNKKNIYPPKSAEQRERLLLLIFSNYMWIHHLQGIRGCEEKGIKPYFYCIVEEEDGCDEYDCTNYKRYEAKEETWNHKIFEDTIYTLTHKLVQENVLSKEEVAKALKGGE